MIPEQKCHPDESSGASGEKPTRELVLLSLGLWRWFGADATGVLLVFKSCRRSYAEQRSFFICRVVVGVGGGGVKGIKGYGKKCVRR